MFRVAPPHYSIIFDERRHHVRFAPRLSSALVFELSSNNGGAVINLSEGGLAVQSTAELRPDEEVLLRFRLQSTEPAIETHGRVVWFGPTNKEAGICFDRLPVAHEQQIAAWIAEQELRVQDEVGGTAPDSETRPVIEPTPAFSTNATASHSELSEASISPADSRVQGVPKQSKSTSRRPAIAMLSVAVVVAVLAIYLFAPNLGRSLGLRASAGEPVGVDSPPVQWISRIKSFFGVGSSNKIEPAKEIVPVWTVQRSGFYYCSDSANYQKLQPGKLMTQGEALQSGFQPKLGAYCH